MSTIHPDIEIVGHGQVLIGQRVRIAPGVQVVFHRAATVSIGDYCTLGPGVKIIVDGGDVSIGDWTSLHDRTLVLSTAGVDIGEHAWFGQHTVIDGTGGLRIGSGVRVGMYSQIWSHVAAGEQIEGCTLFGTRPVVIEDDVWLVGSCIVASGLTIGRRTIALIASNITRSTEPNTVVAGSPAAVKSGLSFYRPIGPDEQWEMLCGWLASAVDAIGLEPVDAPVGVAYRLRDAADGAAIVFVRDDAEWVLASSALPSATVCCLSTKRFDKRLTDVEERVLRHLAGNKARFRSFADNPPTP